MISCLCSMEGGAACMIHGSALLLHKISRQFFLLCFRLDTGYSYSLCERDRKRHGVSVCQVERESGLPTATHTSVNGMIGATSLVASILRTVLAIELEKHVGRWGLKMSSAI